MTAEDLAAAIAPAITALGEGHQEVRHDVDRLVEKLRDVTEALVAADGALAQRVARIERVLDTVGNPQGDLFDTHLRARAEGFGPPADATTPPELKERGLLTKLIRRG